MTVPRSPAGRGAAAAAAVPGRRDTSYIHRAVTAAGVIMMIVGHGDRAVTAAH